ncbi:MAG: nucleotide sugar dehydrogenase [Bacteroidales bacterium]|nr:nucleotide sugar dehydrogenase [Bacteroidales bacterium]
MIEQLSKISVIGLGYVGLPLAAEFAKKYPVLGFDVNRQRVEELTSGHDVTREINDEQLQKILPADKQSVTTDSKPGLVITHKTADIEDCNVYIVTVPTPIDKHKTPDLEPLMKASQTVGKVLNKGDVVIYESTVYPGATEEDCVPVLEEYSKLKFNKDFYVGYSPERINPGDKEHTVATIKKVTAGSTPQIAEKIDNLYQSIITAGTHRASSIKVAEAAKVIENAQRDLNIAFVNELAVLFNKLGIDTLEVLEAAGTKWNFLPFKPGLVGGHCIGVDPYYLTHKATEIGHHPEIILAGRRLNDSMGFRIAAETVKHMIKKGQKIEGSRVLVLGITFKENCPDIRNSRVIDIIEEFWSYNCNVEVYDPWADFEEVKAEYDIELIKQKEELGTYDAIVAAVAHREFNALDPNQYSKDGTTVVYDIKGALPKDIVDARL